MGARYPYARGAHITTTRQATHALGEMVPLPLRTWSAHYHQGVYLPGWPVTPTHVDGPENHRLSVCVVPLIPTHVDGPHGLPRRDPFGPLIPTHVDGPGPAPPYPLFRNPPSPRTWMDRRHDLAIQSIPPLIPTHVDGPRAVARRSDHTSPHPHARGWTANGVLVNGDVAPSSPRTWMDQVLSGLTVCKHPLIPTHVDGPLEKHANSLLAVELSEALNRAACDQ